MRSEFDKLLKQHRDALTDEHKKITFPSGASLQFSRFENEADYEFYFNGAWNAQQSKVDELKLQVAEMKSRLNDAYTDGQSAMYTARQSKIDELQKRVDDLEIQLADWKRKSMPAMLNGMCGRCGKGPLQGIVSDKEDYALLHCFSCGANKYEWIGEQAIKGGSDE